jgi:hypothetical protein
MMSRDSSASTSKRTITRAVGASVAPTVDILVFSFVG